jgi:hypothetical protein
MPRFPRLLRKNFFHFAPHTQRNPRERARSSIARTAGGFDGTSLRLRVASWAADCRVVSTMKHAKYTCLERPSEDLQRNPVSMVVEVDGSSLQSARRRLRPSHADGRTPGLLQWLLWKKHVLPRRRCWTTGAGFLEHPCRARQGSPTSAVSSAVEGPQVDQ